jgi:dienelactone hydrolase
MDAGVNIEAHDEESIKRGMAVAMRRDVHQAVRDMASALAHLRGMPEVSGESGAIGFCLGGSLAYLLAATSDAGKSALKFAYAREGPPTHRPAGRWSTVPTEQGGGQAA